MKERPNQFERRTWRYMLMRIVLSAVFTILNLFINTFLLKSFGNFSSELISYQVIFRAAQPVGVFCALLISSRGMPVVAQVLGLVMYLISLGLLCLFGEGVSDLYPVFAVLLGFADAFFFCVNCMQIMSFTTDENRDRFNGLLCLITGGIAIALPTISGWLIQYFPDFTGYQIVFGLAAACTAVSLFLAVRLPVRREKKSLPHIGATMKRIMKDKNCLRCIAANAISACRGNVLSVFLTMLVYNLISSETVIGLRSALGSLAGLVSAVIYGMAIRSSNRTKSSVVAMVLVLLPCVWMLFDLNVAVLMVFSVVYAFADTFLGTPIAFTYYKSVEALGLKGDSGAEAQFAADIFVALCAIPGFLLIAVIPKTNEWAVALIVAMILTSVATTALIRAADKDLNLHRVGPQRED